MEQARKHAGIDIETWSKIPASYIWLTDEYTYCKADYIVLYRLSSRLDSVSADVQNREIEKKSKASKLKRGN